MTTCSSEYREKLRTPEEAAAIIQSGDIITYSGLSMNPILFDEALAKRVPELHDIILRVGSRYLPCKTVLADPEGKHVSQYLAGFMSPLERRLADEGRCALIPSNYSFSPVIIRMGLSFHEFPGRRSVAVIATTAMDKHGFFNFSCYNASMRSLIETSDIVILEANDKAPVVLGGEQEWCHISEVDYIIEASYPMLALPGDIPASEIDKKNSLLCS